MALKPSDWSVDYFISNESECMEALENTDVLQKIPSINPLSLDNFKDGQLVRFQGMVQDMRNPEYYLKKFMVTNNDTGENSARNGMFIDTVRCEKNESILFDSPDNDSSERQTWIVISTPGLNEWTNKKVSMEKHLNSKLEMSAAESSSNKRSLEEVDEAMDCSEPSTKKEKPSHSATSVSSSSVIDGSDVQGIISKEHIMNFPIPDESGKACIVKVYKEYPYKVNQVIDIIGFLSLDPSLNRISEEILDDSEREILHPPASMVPRLHAIKINEEFNELICEPASIFSRAESIRGDLKKVLSQLLFGDELAADYLICHLISAVYLRKDCICLGAFPLNITHFPKQHASFTKELYNFLKQILMKSHLLEVTIENLNDLTMIPKKDYECNRLTSGLLQLSKNTHLVLDETSLTTGRISESGKQNYDAINNIMIFQEVAYDFKFYTMKYETDIPVLILSDVKSFIPCQTQLVLQPDPEVVKHYPQVLEAANQYLKNESRLNDMRMYVNALKNAKFELSEETSDIIQEDFVKLRQSNKKFSGDDLHSLMVFSRLMALSYGQNSLKPEMWKQCLEKETERIDRLSKSKK